MWLQAMTVDEMLNRAPGSFVLFAHMLKQVKRWPELPVKLTRGISCHWQSTTLLGPIGCESRDNHVAAWFHSLHDLLHIGGAVRRFNQKVENSAVMPDVVRLCWQIHIANIPSNPCNAVSINPQPLASYIQGTCRQVQN